MKETFLVNYNVGVYTINRRSYLSSSNHYFATYHYWTNRLITWIQGTNFSIVRSKTKIEYYFVIDKVKTF